jgi:threonine dehydrogenase-like Zn-dependent dehydrogenase
VRAVVWHGREDLRVDTVPDPTIEEPTDAVVRITSTAICGSDLHLYRGLVPGMKEGDIVGHEPMGVVEAVGAEVPNLAPGDRVVVPFNIACGRCPSCRRGFQSQCETTQNRTVRRGGSLFGYTHLYGGVAGGQAEYLRVPQAHYGPIKVPEGPADERFLLLSDVLPTAWQGVEYAEVPPEGTLAVFGLGPIGQMVARIARHRGAGRVIGVDYVPERLALAAEHGVEVVDASEVDDTSDAVLGLTDGGADSVVDAVGLEADGSRVDHVLQTVKVQPDRLSGLREALGSVRRGGTLSILGVYGGWYPRFPIGDLFDKQITLRMGQANVRRWVDDLLPLLTDGDPLGTEALVTHRLPLADAPGAYELFQAKKDGAVKIVLDPSVS